MDRLLLEKDHLFLKILKIVSYIGIRIISDQKWQKCYKHRDISVFQLILLENYGFEFFYQVWIEGAIFLDDSYLE